MPTLTADNLVSHIQRLGSSGGADNRLVVASRDYYMIFSGHPGVPGLHAEAVSNFYLPRAAELTPARQAVLGQRMFVARAGRNNFYRSLASTTDAELRSFVDDALDVFARAYGVEPGSPAEFDLSFGEPEPTRNPDLLRHMKLLSVMRDWETRKQVYTTFLGATVLLATDSEGGPEPQEVDRLGAFPVWACFTDIDALRLWQPKGAPYKPTRVEDLVPRAVERRIGSLLINPRGNIGGELYINELESLQGALQRRASKI
ncbi:MAG: SseB family protein [Myxococcales bacterium]|nr:SseB family protein [Myxococcales bacterium]